MAGTTRTAATKALAKASAASAQAAGDVQLPADTTNAQAPARTRTGSGTNQPWPPAWKPEDDHAYHRQRPGRCPRSRAGRHWRRTTRAAQRRPPTRARPARRPRKAAGPGRYGGGPAPAPRSLLQQRRSGGRCSLVELTQVEVRPQVLVGHADDLPFVSIPSLPARASRPLCRWTRTVA